MFETWKGRQLLQRGQLAEAAVALEGRFSLENADRVIGREAPNVVALGKLKIHGGDDAGAREVAEIAKLMLRASAPAVQRHGAWYLALHGCLTAKLTMPADWLSARGHANRLKLFPCTPSSKDDPQLVRIAVAVGDGELAERIIEQAERRCEAQPRCCLFPGGRRARESAVARLGARPADRGLALRHRAATVAAASALEDLGTLAGRRGRHR